MFTDLFTFWKKHAPRKGEKPEAVDNPYRSIINWFDKGNHVNVLFGSTDREKMNGLYAVDGLHALVKKSFAHDNEKEIDLLMEFVLHGVASCSLISKKIVERGIKFKDLMGSMLNIQSSSSFDESEKMITADMGF